MQILALLEVEIENKVVEFAKDMGIEVSKMNILGNRNWPDRVFWVMGGRPFLIEFKRPGEEPRRGQWAKITKLRRLGYAVEVCDDIDAGKDIVRRYLAAARLSEKSYQVAAGTCVCGAIPRPGAR